MSEAKRPDPPFRVRMETRLARWYRGADPLSDPERQARRRHLASLVDKSVMTGYISKLGLPLPDVLVEAARLEQVDFAALPDRVVIKPHNGAGSKGVILLDGAQNLMTGDQVARAERAAYVHSIWERDGILARPGARVIIEEFLQDSDPAFRIPRDFKIFAAGGMAHLIQVIDRNPPAGQRTTSFFTRDWRHIRRRIKNNLLPGPAYDRPADLPLLLRMADLISADIGAFYRLDFYMTPRGPVFGEFTSFPSAGRAFTPYGDRLLCAMMGSHPEPF